MWKLQGLQSLIYDNCIFWNEPTFLQITEPASLTIFHDYPLYNDWYDEDDHEVETDEFPEPGVVLQDFCIWKLISLHVAKPELSYNADFARRAIRHGRVPVGRPAVALVTENGKEVWRYLVVWGNYELHGDDGARLKLSPILDRKKSTTSRITLGRLAVQEHGNAIPTKDNLLGLSVTHQTRLARGLPVAIGRQGY